MLHNHRSGRLTLTRFTSSVRLHGRHSAATLALQPRLHRLLKRELLVALAPLAVVPFVAWLVFNRGKNVKIRRLMEKDAVLVAYQEATGQRDRQAAIRALEQHNWNLEVRIRSL